MDDYFVFHSGDKKLPDNKKVVRTIYKNNSIYAYSAGFVHHIHSAPAYRDIQQKNYSISFVLKGTVKFTVKGGVTVVVKPGEVYQRIPQMVHHTVPDSTQEYCEAFFQIPKEYFAAVCATGAIDKSCPILKPGFAIDIVPVIEKFCLALQTYPETSLPDIFSQMFNTVILIAHHDYNSQSTQVYDSSELEWMQNRLQENISSRESLNNILGIRKEAYPLRYGDFR